MMRPLLFVLLGLSACGPNYSPKTYATTAVQQAAKVEQGVVVGVRGGAIAAQGATGAVAGAAAGGAVGSQLPASGGVAATLGAIGGSLLGGIVGSGVEKATGETAAFEYIVRRADGTLVSVTQHDEVALALGTKVLVIAGSQARIVADYTVTHEAPAAVPSRAAVQQTEPAARTAEPQD